MSTLEKRLETLWDDSELAFAYAILGEMPFFDADVKGDILGSLDGTTFVEVQPPKKDAYGNVTDMGLVVAIRRGRAVLFMEQS